MKRGYVIGIILAVLIIAMFGIGNVTGEATYGKYSWRNYFTKVQKIDLEGDSKLNLISFYVQSKDLNPESVFAPIVNDLEIVQDMNGGVYVPADTVFVGHPGTNTIGEIDLTQAYQVKLKEGVGNVELVVHGKLIRRLSTTLKTSIREMVAYPSRRGMSTKYFFSCIEDDEGNQYVPGEVNTIKRMRPDKGYYVTVSEDVDFGLGRFCRKK